MPLRLLALYADDPDSLADALGLIPADPATANIVIAVPQDGDVLADRLAPAALVLADLLTLPGRADAKAEPLMDALARTDPAWRGIMNVAPEYIIARRVLLDALAALERQLPSLVLVGARAVYLHTGGDADLNVPLLSTDADLALDTDSLGESPRSARSFASQDSCPARTRDTGSMPERSRWTSWSCRARRALRGPRPALPN